MKRTSRLAAVVLACLATAATADEPLPAFPGAEGFGAASVGGRADDCKVIKVTNLNARGPGSLQAACEAEGPRIVVFEVGGAIKGNINIKQPNITIAGQTAPGGGVTIEGMLQNPYRIKPNLHDVVIRFLRVRPPQATKKSEGGDCLQLTDIDRLMIDHVSCSWGSDENVDVCGSRQITVQWCAIEESDTTGHSEGQHNFGMIMGYAGKDATVHHNLFAQHKDRAPLCGLETLDHRNNVIYNYKSPLQWHPTRMNEQRPNQPFKANVVGNYFKAGPNVKRDKAEDKLDRLMWKRPWVNLFAADNYFDWTGKVAEPTRADRNAPPPSTQADVILTADRPWPAPPVQTQSAKEAYELVLAKAGCLPRDAVGKRAVEEVRTGGGSWGRHDPAGGLMEGLPTTQPAARDGDNDGLPDEWEAAHKLNANDPADAAKAVPAGASENDRHKGYLYIEYYVNELADQLVK